MICAVLTLQLAANDANTKDANLVLPVPAAIAATESEMKPYAEPLEHTELQIEMVPIPGGTFLMGSPENEEDRNEDEGPQREVKISPFWIGKYEITWDQYDTWSEEMDQLRRKMFSIEANARDAVVDGISKPTEPYTDMSFGMGKGEYPAICMTQHAARTFCKWLSAKTGRYYRLPTEAEWEYACRAGTTTAYSFGDDPGRTGGPCLVFRQQRRHLSGSRPETTEPVGAVRHARERRRMGAWTSMTRAITARKTTWSTR